MDRQRVELEKRRFVPAFAASFGLGAAARLASQRLDHHFGGHPSAAMILLGAALGLAALAAALYYALRSYRLASALEHSRPVALGFGFMALFPLLNLVIVLVLLRRARAALSP